MGVTLFHHPEAGEGAWSADDLLGALRDAGFDAEYRSADEEGWRDGLAATESLAIVAGGDGTVARLAANLPDRRVPMALLPTGSANNIARSLGCHGPLDVLIAGLFEAAETMLHVGEARGRWGLRRFVEAVGIGAVADTVAELQDDKLSGHNKQAAGRDALCRTLRGMKPMRVAPVLDGEPIEEPMLLLEALNIAMIGPNLALAPGAGGNGRLTVAWLPESGREGMLDWLAEGGQGAAPLSRREAACVEIAARDERLRIDDKTVVWDGHRMDLSLDPVPVRIKVPRRAGEGAAR